MGEKAKLEQMLVYATLQLSIDTLPVNKAEFEALLKQVKQQFLTHGQQALEVISDIFVQWQDIRRQLMMLDGDIFGRSIDDIEDQLDLMQLSDFVYTQGSEVWLEYPRYLKALLMRLDRLPNNLKRDESAIADVDPWMDKLFKFKHKPELKEIYFMVEELRISLFSQPMKTKMPVSSSRLQKAWQRLGIQ